jgi:putative ABC transport system substrate-binding protein
MSYGGNLLDQYIRLTSIPGRILKGEKPVDLPVQQSTKVAVLYQIPLIKTRGPIGAIR